MALTYQTGARTVSLIYTASSGGTVFSANKAGTAAFDYFSDSAVVDDAIYFGFIYDCSKINLNIGTPLAGTDVVIKWEFYQRDLSAYGGSVGGWTEIPSQQDDTVGFTESGAQSFKFGLPYGWIRFAVNSQSYLWVRARIVSLTTITEGGANSTSTVSALDAEVNVDDYTDVSPCRLEDIYQYILTNAPWVNIPKGLDQTGHITYDMREVVLDLNSRLLCLNETLDIGFFGNANNYTGLFDLRYLQMGQPLGTEFGIDGCTLRMHGQANTCTTWSCASTEMKFYDSVIDGVYGTGYPTWYAQCVYCVFKNFNPTPNENGSFINCLILNAGIWIIQGSFFGVFDKCKMVLRTSSFNALGLFYNSSVTINDLDYEFESLSAAQMIYVYNSQPASTRVWRFHNPIKPMPSQTGSSPRMIYRGTSTNPVKLFTKVWFYDDSAGTYTDYTTEAGDATADDLPIHGDVDDYLYFGSTDGGMSTGTVFMGIVTSLSSNDYEYEWEYYGNGAWRPCDTTYADTTDNFTTSLNTSTGAGVLHAIKDDSYMAASLLTVNGTSSYWLRMRIKTKGTGTPSISKISWYSENAATKWNAYESYSLDLKVTDSDGEVEDADVSIDIGATNYFSGQTDASGDITQQTLAKIHWYFDPVNYWTTQYKIAEQVYESYTVTVSKLGYETYSVVLPMDRKRIEVVKLKKAIDLMASNKGMAIRVDPTNSTVDRDLLIMP